MRATLSFVPKYILPMTTLLAASMAPLQAASPHSHHTITMPAGQANGHRPMLKLDSGVGLLYSFEMSSQALFDMSKALQQQDRNADSSQAPKMTVQTRLKGTIELVRIGSARHRTQVLCTLRPRELHLQQNGREVTEPLSQLSRQLTLPVLIEYTDRGQIASVRFDSNCEATARGFARTLLAYLQFTRPDRVTQPTWLAREDEPNGTFVTRYTRQAGGDTLTLSKTKCGPAAAPVAPGTEQLQMTERVTPAGTLTVVLDTRRGLIRAVSGQESFATVLGSAPVARSLNRISLGLQGRTSVTPARSQSLLGIARARLQQAPGLSLAQLPEITAGQEAQIQRANLGNATVEQVLNQVKALDQSAEPEKEARTLLPRLKACIYLHPEICRALQARLRSARPDKIGMALIVEALRASGNPAAQKTLIDVLKARHKEINAAGLLIPALAQLQNPIPQVERTLLEIALGKGEPFITSTACLALGALAHTLAPSTPERAHQITRMLQRHLEHARTDSQKRTLLLALANAAQPTTLPTLLHQARDRSPEVRGTALIALARLPGTQPERLLCAALTNEQDARVRMAAAAAAEGKLNSAAVRKGLLQVLQHDRDAQVRIRALYALWNGVRQRPEVMAGVQTTARQDASEDVRKAARSLLAQK